MVADLFDLNYFLRLRVPKQQTTNFWSQGTLGIILITST
jgi:hypothetical protein